MTGLVDGPSPAIECLKRGRIENGDQTGHCACVNLLHAARGLLEMSYVSQVENAVLKFQYSELGRRKKWNSNRNSMHKGR